MSESNFQDVSAGFGARSPMTDTERAYRDGFEDGQKSANGHGMSTLVDSFLHVPAVNKALGDFVHGLISKFWDDEMAHRIEAAVNSTIDSKIEEAIGDYNPTEHSDFDNAVESVIENYDLSDQVSSAVDDVIDDKVSDKIDSHDFGSLRDEIQDHVFEEIRNRLT